MINNTEDPKVDLSKTLKQKGPKFRSHTVILNKNTAYLKPTMSALLFCVVYVIVGVFLLALALLVYLKSQQLDLTLFLAMFGIAITTFGSTLLIPFTKRISFNKDTDKFKNNIDRTVKIKNIVSLQIANKMVRSKHGISYPCFELNLLTVRGRRVNILNHNDLNQLKSDGEELAEFLSVPLLDLRRDITL